MVEILNKYVELSLKISRIRTDWTIGQARNRFADVLLGSYKNGANEQQEDGEARVQPEDYIVNTNGFFL